MLSHAKLPKSFLAEAIRTEVYLINLSNLAWMEPEFGRGKMYLTVTQILAAAAGLHIPKDESTPYKLDDKAKQCIFLGYGYRHE